MSWASKQKVQDCESKLLLFMLAEHASLHDSDDYTCWPGVERLCQECLLSDRTIKLRLKSLADSGVISITNRKDKDGRNLSNLYTLMIPKDPQGVADTPGGGSAYPRDGVPGTPEPVIGTSKINQLYTQAEEIYEAYPRKTAKKAAITAIIKALKGNDHQFLLDRTRLFSDAKAGADLQYIPYPATWFNQERFNDDPETWKYRHGNQKLRPNYKTVTDNAIDLLNKPVELPNI